MMHGQKNIKHTCLSVLLKCA